MCTGPIHEVPAYAHWPNSHFPHGWCTIMCPHTPFPLTFCQFSHTQVLPCMFQIQSHCHIWTQSPTLSPTSWSDPASTLAPEALLLGGWHTHWRPTCQGASETGNVSHPSAHRTPTDLQNRRSRGQVPAECLEQKMLYAYATVCTQGDFTLSRK